MTKNIVKGIITSAIGVATMVTTLMLLFSGSISFVWEGIAGLAMGVILLLAPDTIIKKLGDVISAIGGRGGNSGGNVTPDNPDADDK